MKSLLFETLVFSWVKFIFFTITGTVLLFLPEAYNPLSWIMGVVLLAVSFESSQKLTHGRRLEKIDEYEVLWRDGPVKNSLAMEKVCGIFEDPARGLLGFLLKDGGKLQFERSKESLSLLNRATQMQKGEPWRETGILKLLHSLIGLFTYIFLILIQLGMVAVGFLTPDTQPWIRLISSLPLLPISYLVFYLIFSYPLSFEIFANQIKIRSLLRTRLLMKKNLEDFRFDKYLYGGAPYFLLRFVFKGKSIVFDEFSLHNPIFPARAWIFENWVAEVAEEIRASD